MSANLKEALRSGHFPSLVAAFLFFDMSFMIWVLLGPLGNHISAELGLSPSQKGLLVAIPILGGAFFRIFMGILTDWIGPKKSALLAMTLTPLPLLWGWLGAERFGEILGVGLLLGIPGASFAAALPLASRNYPAKHQGLAMGLAGAGNSGTVLTALFAPRLADAFGWNAVMGLALIPLVLVFVAFLLLAREPVLPPRKKLSGYFSILAEGDLWFFNLFYSLTFGGFVGLGSFLPIFFHDQYGVSKVMAGTLTAFCVMSGSFLRPVGGALADQTGGLRALSLFFSVVAVLILGLACLPTLGVAVALAFLTLGVLGLGNGAVFQLVPQRFRDEIGVATGWIGAAGGVGGFCLPPLLGVLKETLGTYAAGFGAFAVGIVFCAGVLRFVRKDWERWSGSSREVRSETVLVSVGGR
ncbi:MAG: NarK/NasA family nitrate transporter [Nitrospirae bacterium]|nr:NarK/NasA family nitrate transporter [Nitrospirota bacterium]